MESQPQNPEFRNNPENFHPCVQRVKAVKPTFYNSIGCNLYFLYKLSCLTCTNIL